MALIQSGDLSFDTEQETSGTFGEGQAIEAAAFLKGLRAQLDAGEISVDDFLTKGAPVAELGINRGVQSVGLGGAAAVGSALTDIRKAGFIEKPGGSRAAGSIEVQPRLPEQFREEALESIIPKNVDPEVRKRLIAQIPADIEIGSDRFNIERERIRQQVQAEQELVTRTGQREEQLTGLEQLLQQQQERAFRRATPILTEQLQTQGLLQTSELESAFGREQARLTAASGDIIAGERLRAQQLGIGEELDIQAASRRFQSQGLQREFSLADFQKEAQVARQIAELSRPRGGGGRGKSGAGTAIGSVIGAPFGPVGSTIGGIIGSGF